MNILITGGTGFIGSALCNHFGPNTKITVLSRQPSETVHKLCGNQITSETSLSNIDSSAKYDAVINLAGEPIADSWWTRNKKAKIEQSRYQTTQDCVDLIERLKHKPDVFISGSAVGYYGDQGSLGDEPVIETSSPNQEYTHTLCKKWETIANQASKHCRVAIMRTGLVLGTNGGMLARLWLPFKMGTGGKLGNGQQYMPWIHLQDMVNAIVYIFHNPNIAGPINMTAPTPVTNKVFTKTLANELNRPAFFHMPALVLKVLFGEMSRLLLTGQKAYPKKLLDAGYEFRFTKLDEALSDIHNTKRNA